MSIDKNLTDLEKEQLKNIVANCGFNKVEFFIHIYKRFMEHKEFCACKCFHECCDNPDNYQPPGRKFISKSQQYYQHNKEKIKARNKLWYETNLKKNTK